MKHPAKTETQEEQWLGTYRLSDSTGHRSCKTDVLRLRLTPQEKLTIEKAARLADETLSSFVYEAIQARVRRWVKEP